MNPALVHRPDNRFKPALVRAGLGLSSRAQGVSSKSQRPCGCTSGPQSSAQTPWAFLSVGPTGECSSGGRCGGDCGGGGGCGGESRYKRATTKAMSGADKCPPFTRYPRPKDPPRKPEHPKHPTKPKAPESKHFRDPESPGCFVPAIENPTFGPHEPEVEDLIWTDGQLVDVRDVGDEALRRIEYNPLTVRGLCVRPQGFAGPVPFVLMMHQAGGGLHRYHGYRAIQLMLASHGIASVCSSDNSRDDETFKHEGLEFSDEARRAKLCLQLAERFAAARQLRFGPRIGLLGHSRGGWAAQNVATLINLGPGNLHRLAIDPESFRNVRVEGLCLVGSSSHHAADPTCPVLLIQGSRDEDLKLAPSWWLAGRAPSGFISVAYVRNANHNWFNRTNADDQWMTGRRGPNSPPLLSGDEHVRILTGLAVSLFRLTILGHPTELMNGTAVLPFGAAGSSYRIAFRASDCVALLHDFGPSSLHAGRGLELDSLVHWGSNTPDVEVHPAVFSGLAADTVEWPEDVSVYVQPGESRAAMVCCGHGLIIRQSGAGRESPLGDAIGLRFPLPAELDLADWMIAITAAAVDPNPIYAADAARIRPSFVGGAFYAGVESPLTGSGPAIVTWSSPRRLWPNDDLQFESTGSQTMPTPGLGFQERVCTESRFWLGHLPYFCYPREPDSPPPRNNGTTAYATTYWFPAECFAKAMGSPELRATAVWLYPSLDAAIAIQRVDLIRRERLFRV